METTTTNTTTTTTQPGATAPALVPEEEEGGGGDEEEAFLSSVMLNSGVVSSEEQTGGGGGSVEQQLLASSQQETGLLGQQQQQQNPSAASFSTSLSLPRIRWSTSICGLFRNPTTRRSDFCAITCCGILLKDRNQYLLNVLDEELEENNDGAVINVDSMIQRMRNDRTIRARSTTNWKSRCFFIFMIPFGIMMITNYMLNLAVSSSPSNEDQNNNEDRNNTQNYTAIIIILRLFLLGYVIYWLYQSKIYRSNLRQAIISKMMLLRPSSFRDDEEGGRGGGGSEGDDATMVLQLQLASRNSREFRSSTPMCCASFEKEHDYYHAGDDDYDYNSSEEEDMATCLWNSLAKSCCGLCCGCWCQLCGMCSIGQEDRELEKIFQQQERNGGNSNNNYKRLFHIDYITFQPWIEYYTKILEVRNRRLFNNGDWAGHLGALSELSQHILKWFAAGVLWMLLMSILTKSVTSFCINIIGTTFKTVVVLYLVYWKSNRYDISLDAIIKYVAAGFVLSTFMAVIVEQLLMTVLSPIGILFVVFDVLTVDTGDTPLDQWLQDPKNIEELMQSHLGQAAIMAFVFSFIVAAFVEELMKYMTYWMTETPDLLTLDELGLSQQGSTPTTTEEDSKLRRSRAITIAMVAVATGFAWSENIGYIRSISAKPAGLSGGTTTNNVWADELALLLFRSIMPVHELCAAIQSIGIVRRDIEHDRSWKLGRSLFPAILLHGTYDFVAIFGGMLQKVLSGGKDDGDDGHNDEGGGSSNSPDNDESPNPLQMLQMFLMVAPIVLLGAWYYYRQAKLQRQRLETTDGYDGVATTGTMRGTATSMQVILEEEEEEEAHEDLMVEGSGDGLDAPLLEASSSSGVTSN